MLYAFCLTGRNDISQSHGSIVVNVSLRVAPHALIRMSHRLGFLLALSVLSAVTLLTQSPWLRPSLSTNFCCCRCV